jgi:hypothetical protein
MKAIFDKQGKSIAWLDNCYIYNLTGHQIMVFVECDCVFTYKGKCLGLFTSGFFRDSDGYAVAFIKGASVGPMLPNLELPPLPPFPQATIFPPLVSLPPWLPADRMEWSSLTWNQFLKR